MWFGLAAIEGAAARDRVPFCGFHFRARSQRLGDLDSRFLVALPLSEDLLLVVKYLFIVPELCAAVITQRARPAGYGELGIAGLPSCYTTAGRRPTMG